MVDKGGKPQASRSFDMDNTSHPPPPPPRRGDGRTAPKKRKVEDYKHYAAIVADDDGRCHMVSSPSFKRHKRAMLANAIAQAREILVEVQHTESRGSWRTWQPAWKLMVPRTKPPQAPPDAAAFPSRQSWDGPDVAISQHKRQCVQASERPQPGAYDGYTGQSDGSPLQEVPEPKSTNSRKEVTIPESRREIRPSETNAWESWFADGFTLIQQTACRTIAKEWIKVIHPKKQSTHPYNGKVPRNLGDDADPERTKPPYWPPRVRHKEPDHIDKAARTALLVHLLMHTPQEEIVPEKTKSERTFTARDLLAALQKKQDEGVAVKWPILQELIHIREILENYEQGGMDDEATITVPDWSEVLRAAGSRRKVPGGATIPANGNSVDHVNNETDEVASDTTEETSSGREVAGGGLPPAWSHDLKHEVFTQPVPPPTKQEIAVKAEPRSLVTQYVRPRARKGRALDYGLAHPFHRDVVGFGDADTGVPSGLKISVPQEPKFGAPGWPRAPADTQQIMMLDYSGLVSPDEAVSMGDSLGMGEVPSYAHLQPNMQNAIGMSPYSAHQSYMFDGDRIVNGGYMYDGFSHGERAAMSAEYGQAAHMYQH